MLNKAERFQLLKTFGYWFKLGSLPAEVDLTTWQILPPTKRQTTWKCHFLFCFFVLNAVYKLVTLVYWLKVGIQLHEAVVHTVLAASMPVITFWYYVLYIKNPRLFSVYLHMTLTGNKYGHEVVVVTKNTRSWSRRLKECSIHDLFAMSISYVWPLSCTGIMLIYTWNPSLKCFLYAALPTEHQTWITFGILLFEEWWSIMVMCAIGAPALTAKVISFEVVRNELQLLISSMKRTDRSKKPGYVFKSLRAIQLYVGIANLINCYLIFSLKLLTIFVSVGTGYAAIAHFGAYPVFGIMYYLMFASTCSMYIFSYDKAFEIPALFQEVTQRAVLATYSGNDEASKIFKRQMRSFPRVGIKVGKFYLMERESTMNFIDFVFNNIVSLLVAYG